MSNNCNMDCGSCSEECSERTAPKADFRENLTSSAILKGDWDYKRKRWSGKILGNIHACRNHEQERA